MCKIYFITVSSVVSKCEITKPNSANHCPLRSPKKFSDYTSATDFDKIPGEYGERASTTGWRTFLLQICTTHNLNVIPKLT